MKTVFSFKVMPICCISHHPERVDVHYDKGKSQNVHGEKLEYMVAMLKYYIEPLSNKLNSCQ